MSSFARLATTEAQIYRASVVGSRRSATPALHLDDLLITPLTPADSDAVISGGIRQREGTDAPLEILETFLQGEDEEGAPLDIREGDLLDVAGARYTIRVCGDWPPMRRRDKPWKRLLVEELKQQ